MFIDDPEVTAAEAVIDNGSFGKRVVRFETGRLAKQAAGSAMAYLDGETAVLSATTVGKHPKDQFDFFPLTVDVEERQYAAGRIPGSFFRREGRAGTAAILACRLIDRPLRPSFVKGLRNEVQVVETVLAIHPDDDYDVLAINAASMSTQIAGLPFSGPVAGTRLALIDGHWVAFPRYSEQQRATFQMVVAGRVLESGDVAIMMVEAGATEHAWELINAGAVAPTRPSSPRAWRPPSLTSRPCARPSSRSPSTPRSPPPSSPSTWTTPTSSTTPSRRPPRPTAWPAPSPPRASRPVTWPPMPCATRSWPSSPRPSPPRRTPRPSRPPSAP